MYVAIDMTNMRFLNKHQNPFLLSDLCHIECPRLDYSVEPCDSATFLSTLSDMELKMLYRNTTGVERSSFGNATRAILMELVQRMPEVDANLDEVSAQAACLPEANVIPHLYVKGSKCPAKQPPNHELAFYTGNPSADEAQIGLLGRSAAVKLYPGAEHSAPQAPGHCAAPVVQQQSRSRAVPQATRPRASGVRETIWKVADQFWEGDGKPTSKERVLALRKNMMEVLEKEYGVKRTSSSNELGNWQKERIR